jgi:hypothetical protein
LKKQNITLSLSRELIKKAKHIAIDRNTSVSGLLSKMLEEIVEKDNSYKTASENQKKTMNKYDLGTNGAISWNREELHDR